MCGSRLADPMVISHSRLSLTVCEYEVGHPSEQNEATTEPHGIRHSSKVTHSLSHCTGSLDWY